MTSMSVAQRAEHDSEHNSGQDLLFDTDQIAALGDPIAPSAAARSKALEDATDVDEMLAVLTGDFLASIGGAEMTPAVYEADVTDPTSGETITVRALSLAELEREIDAAFGVITDEAGYEIGTLFSLDDLYPDQASAENEEGVSS